MANVAPLRLKAFAGEDYLASGTHYSSSAASTPVDITGWTITFTVRKRPSDAAVLLAVTAAVVSGPAGTYTIGLTSAQTATLGVGEFSCDIWRTDSGANTEMAIGLLSVSQPVHHVA